LVAFSAASPAGVPSLFSSYSANQRCTRVSVSATGEGRSGTAVVVVVEPRGGAVTGAVDGGDAGGGPASAATDATSAAAGGAGAGRGGEGGCDRGSCRARTGSPSALPRP
jgi:hypothetical protein